MRRPQPTLKAGEVLRERYVIDRPLATGGTGVVYLATDRSLARAVAVKVMATPVELGIAHEEFQARFRREAEVLATLHHPHIVVVHDHGTTTDGHPFLVMEHVEGPRYADLLKQGFMRTERIVSLMHQVCRALLYAHRRGVVHRDLKPTNLLIRESERESVVKVVDFGLVKLLDRGHEEPITATGTVVGSPHYMAPEQIMSDPVGPWTDIYAVGILLFRSLTGQYPFHGPTPSTTMAAHLSSPTPAFADAAPDRAIDPELEEVVRKCLEKEPNRRWEDMAELCEALLPFTEVALELSSRTPVPMSSITGRRGRTEVPASLPAHVPSWTLPITLVVGLGLGLAAGWLIPLA